MSEQKTVITQIFEKLDGLKAMFEKAPEQKKFEQATLKDGTVVQWEGELAVGTALFVVAEDGEALPAPDGQHEVEGGLVVTTVDGIVTEIVEAKAEEVMEVTPEEQTAIVTEVMQIIEPRLAAIEEQLAMLGDFAKVEQVKEFTSQVIEAVKSVGSEVEKFKAMPQPEPKKKEVFEDETLTPLQKQLIINRKNK
jgi:hypothetical protein